MERRPRFLPLTSQFGEGGKEPTQLEADDLYNIGFSQDEVRSLIEIQNSDPAVRELFDTEDEWNKLCFFKWICEHGGCSDYPEEKKVDNRLEHWLDGSDISSQPLIEGQVIDI